MKALHYAYLYYFAKESNEIENIHDVMEHMDHYERLKDFVEIEYLQTDHLVTFNRKAGAPRACHGMNVMVGNHVPPAGGPTIIPRLAEIVDLANNEEDPYVVHHRFETLHPFMDGNGRTGRALWLWQMWNQHGYTGRLGFLHQWYYQSLSHDR